MSDDAARARIAATQILTLAVTGENNPSDRGLFGDLYAEAVMSLPDGPTDVVWGFLDIAILLVDDLSKATGRPKDDVLHYLGWKAANSATQGGESNGEGG